MGRRDKGAEARGATRRRRGQEAGHHCKPRRTGKAHVSDAADAAFVRALAVEGWHVEIMASDGNCMFRSLGHQLHGDADQHLLVRGKVMDYIERRQEHFELFLEDDESFEDYVTRLRTFGEWGDHTELYAAAQCFGASIIIHQADAPTYMIEGGGAKAIHLSFHGECHYNSVVAASPAVDVAVPMASVASAMLSPDDMNRVSRSVPWVDDDSIQRALLQCCSDVDAAIDLLCAGAAGVSLDDAPAGSSSSPPTAPAGADVHGKARTKAPALSKKERRKLDKQALLAPPPTPPPVQTSERSGTMVLSPVAVIAI